MSNINLIIEERPRDIGNFLVGRLLPFPFPVHSPLYFLELKSKVRQTINISDKLYGECGLYILEGNVEIDGIKYASKELLVAKDSQVCEFIMEANTTVFFFGGEPFAEGRLIYWNFVATDQALIDNAKDKWRTQAFDKIKGETDFVPLPLEHK
jgi:redox-sensitive bicupin YhaK (pirin superfamily)